MPEIAHVSVIDRTRVPIKVGGQPVFAGLFQAFGKFAPGLFKTRKIERFKMQEQCHSNWCWATVASSVSLCYDAHSPHTQCAVANSVLDRPDCCTFKCHSPGTPGEVNKPNVLGSALNSADHILRLFDPDVQAIPSQIQQEIEAERPVCARIEWRVSGGAHFIVIVGYDPATGKLDIADSLFGPQTIPFDEFKVVYQQEGKWNDTYYTKPPPPA
jgi:hypothetical protein